MTLNQWAMTDEDMELIADVGALPLSKVRAIVHLAQLAMESVTGRSGGSQALRASGPHLRRGVGASQTEKLPLPQKATRGERGRVRPSGDNAIEGQPSCAGSPSREVPARIGDVADSIAIEGSST